MKNLILLSAAFVLVVASCKINKTTTGVAVPVNDTVCDYSFRKITRDKELYAAVKEMVPLDTAYLTKDTLHILTKKILGCDADNFKLFWSGAMQKSLPQQTSVKLFQQVDAECKEQHRFHLTYNVKPLRAKNDSASFNLDSCTAKTTLLRIGGYKEMVRCEF